MSYSVNDAIWVFTGSEFKKLIIESVNEVIVIPSKEKKYYYEVKGVILWSTDEGKKFFKSVESCYEYQSKLGINDLELNRLYRIAKDKELD